jgi:hypothetical protein
MVVESARLYGADFRKARSAGCLGMAKGFPHVGLKWVTKCRDDKTTGTTGEG